MTGTRYMSGFGNHFETEAELGALPAGQNSPQQSPLGLYAEKFSGSAFTAPREQNFRSWLYRIQPAAGHPAFEPLPQGLLRGYSDARDRLGPNQLRWQPHPIPNEPCDFVDGLATIAVNGDLAAQIGLAIHVYRANQPMADRYFFSADGEFLIVAEHGGLRVRTELGVLEIEPGEIALLPRGMRFSVDPTSGEARGYVAENFGAPLSLPERGPIGTDGLANTRDFLAPVAAYEDVVRPCELVAKFGGHLFATTLDRSPLDVVAWHGNLAPYKYDLRRFNTIGSISYDHPDPSIFTVLTSQSNTPGVANLDFAIFPPRWLVMEDTFRPPWYHRNVMSEFMGLIYGDYDAKAGGGFVPGGASLHNALSAHGPDRATFEKASDSDLKPQKLDATMAFMFESRYVFEPTAFALDSAALDTDYLSCWDNLPRNFKKP